MVDLERGVEDWAAKSEASRPSECEVGEDENVNVVGCVLEGRV